MDKVSARFLQLIRFSSKLHIMTKCLMLAGLLLRANEHTWVSVTPRAEDGVLQMLCPGDKTGLGFIC